ncbi:5239_t:CDS:2 [Ambispora leptoticha]|uniref:5239_t:CDS:1 n=1 Tax=Ambispora leptoticha TaxID=144679 RepID=A0A9N8WLJ6_9GLOM|nr:5239_t:CDS:2 [Ambispora leptoticha]
MSREKSLDDDGLKAEWVSIKGDQFFNEGTRQRVVLYLHGGAFYLCNAASVMGITYRLAQFSTIDYRTAPKRNSHDTLAAYLNLLDLPTYSEYKPFKPNQIVFAGDSAGGGLTFATLLALRDAGLPIPVGVNVLARLNIQHAICN